MYTFFLLHKNGIRSSQYLRSSVLRAPGQSSGGRIRATPVNSGPIILPRMMQGATRSCGLFLIRLYFPESLRLITYSLSSPSPNHTGVQTAVPFFRKVASETYFWP